MQELKYHELLQDEINANTDFNRLELVKKLKKSYDLAKNSNLVISLHDEALIAEYQEAIDVVTIFLEKSDDEERNSSLFFDRITLRGDLYFIKGDYNQAIEDYRNAIVYYQNRDYLKDLVRTLKKRGKCYEALQEEAKAKADFEEAGRLRSNNIAQ